MPPWHLQDTLRKFTAFCRIDTAVAVRCVGVGQHFQDECPLELVSVWRFHVQQSFNTGERPAFFVSTWDCVRDPFGIKSAGNASSENSF